MDNHDEDPDEENTKVAAAAEIILKENHDGSKKFNLTEAVRATGVFKAVELSKLIVERVKAEMKRQVHRTKTRNRPSLGGLKTPRNAKRWAAQCMVETTTKGHFAGENYKTALSEAGFNISVDEIKVEKKKLMRKERDNKDHARPSKPPHPITTTTDSSTTDHNSLEDSQTAIALHSAVASIPEFQVFDERNKREERGPKDDTRPSKRPRRSTVPVDSSLEDRTTSTAVSGDNYSTNMDYDSLEDGSTAMAPHSAAASTPGFQGFYEPDGATPQTAALGRRRLGPIFEDQDSPSPSQDLLAEQDLSHHVCSQHELKKLALMMKSFHDELVPAFFDSTGKARQGVDVPNVENVLFELVDKLRSRTVARATAILDGKAETEANETPHPSAPQVDPSKYPSLSNFGVTLDDPRILAGIQREMWQMNRDENHTTTMNVDPGNGGNLALVTVPRPKSSDLDALRHNQTRTGFLGEICGALEPDGVVTDDSKRKLCYLLAKDKEHRPFFREIAHLEGISTIDRLDEATSFAIQSEAGINDSAARSLRRCFTAALGNPILASESKMKANLGYTRADIERGIYNSVVPPPKKKQRIRWSCKKLDQVLLYYLEALAEKGTNTIDHCDLVVSIDHGKGSLRAILTITVRKNREERDSSESFALAEAKCNGDTYDILKNTFASNINDAFHRIKASGYKVSVYRKHEGGEIYSKLGAEPDNVADILLLRATLESWIAGDLKFFMMATGRESADKIWCFYCNLMAKEWKSDFFAQGTEWTNETLKSQFLRAKRAWRSMSPFQRKGCNKAFHGLLFDAIAIDHFSTPSLHLLLGLVNCIYVNIVAELQAGYESYTDEYFKLEAAMGQAEETLAKIKEERRRHELFSGNNITYWKVSTCQA
jgi:hypothetical protein